MITNTINARLCAKMFLAGAKNLESQKEWINELNVFPVPDGDTGTNMTLTIMSAAKEVASLNDITMESLAKAISSGSLRGARGNSGVILSQLFRGFTKGIKSYEEIDTVILASAMQKAVETAYKAVMKPKEGTILTVAKGAADKAAELAETDMDLKSFMGAVIDHADRVLAQTPEMLPVLKEAGVVDSGGQGLMQVLRGAYDAFLGKQVDYSIEGAKKSSAPAVKTAPQAEADIKFGYCTEFIIMLEKEYSEDIELEFKAFLNSIGDSIVVVSDEDIVKVHVHTNDPGKAISRALTYGSLTKMKIDNMREEHQEKLIKDAEKMAAKQAKEDAEKTPKKDVGFISVSIGEGVGQIFRDLGVDYLIEGGQTMNPSTADILEAVEQVNARTVFILPNNKNIILAANQAAELVTDKDLLVIPTKTIPQGITAVINFVPELSADENEEAMLGEIGNVSTGQVTYAVHDAVIDDKEIKKGDYMGIGDNGILAVGGDMAGVAKYTVEGMMTEDAELISIYYGSDVKEEEAESFRAQIEEQYPQCDIELQYGGQPIYYYIMSVE